MTEMTRGSTDRVTVDLDIHAHMLATYASLRLLIALVTFAFLFTLAGYREFGGDSVNRHSISAYYYHDNTGFRMKDVFVGALTAVGLLLMAYQGFTDRENWALNISGVALLCVVAFPMSWNADKKMAGDLEAIGRVHYASAIAFFFSLGYVVLYRSHDTLGLLPDGPRKMAFKNLYRITGTFMWAVPAIAIALEWTKNDDWVYIVEYFGVFVFVVYWVVKSYEMKLNLGETRDGVREAAERTVGPQKYPPATGK